jgi:hypothetical protein
VRHYRLDPVAQTFAAPFSMQPIVAAVKEAFGLFEKNPAPALAK